MQCLKVLVPAFREKTALVVLLAVLPPTLITLALTASVSAVGLLSEDLVRHFSGRALLMTRKPVGSISFLRLRAPPGKRCE